jgi:late competence protein required for DNA uptake (superfamily II DNA/RNA helicase)
MSGENCLGSSENFGNRPKTRYPTDFAVEPIEYIYIYMCIYICIYMCVCVVHGQVKKKQKIYGLKQLKSNSMNKILYK